MKHLAETDRQRFQLSGVTEAWLDKPLQYQPEARAAAEQLEPGENVTAVFSVVIGLAISDGTLFVTDRRLLFVRVGLLTRRLHVRSILFAEIRDVALDNVPMFPAIKVRLRDGKQILIKSTFASRGGIDELRRLIAERLISRCAAS